MTSIPIICEHLAFYMGGWVTIIFFPILLVLWRQMELRYFIGNISNFFRDLSFYSLLHLLFDFCSTILTIFLFSQEGYNWKREARGLQGKVFRKKGRLGQGNEKGEECGQGYNGKEGKQE